MGQTEGDRDKEEDTSVSISADSTWIFTSAMTLMISTSNPGLSAVSIQSKLINIELKRIRWPHAPISYWVVYYANII